MKILLTGSNGYVGSALKNLLGQDLVTLDRQGLADIRNCMSQLFLYRKYLSSIHTVIHLADMRLQHYTKENIIEQNKLQHEFLSQVSYLPNLKKVIFASSCSVYGCSDTIINESSAPNPTSLYAESKLKTEEKIKELGLPHLILRFGTAFGLSAQLRLDLLVNELVYNIINSQKMKLFDMKSVRPYIHVKDFARTLVVGTQKPHFGLINVVSQNASKLEILDMVQNLFSSENAIEIDETKKDIRNYFVDSSHCRNLGFDFLYDLKSGMNEIAGALA